ncbi:MAG TPA: hypothetical protein PKA00_19220 [Saprospiraceae bacterium]|nr:hypothetical protein [Saprospiraceae bacterium]HMQ85049.1 hypothetical protein [Saprospiraceae bacterium]
MKILPVNDKASWKLFHQVPYRIYKDNRVWICPLQGDVQAVFTPGKNKAFQRGEAQCYVLLDESGQAAGRIAAFIDHERNQKSPWAMGSLGYFECIEQEEYAFALFEQAAAYLAQWGVKIIEGPVNFGEREKFWGLLASGFDKAPLYQENYHPPYYEAFFSNWGFRPFEQVLTLKGDIAQVPIGRFTALARRVKDRFPVTLQHPDMKNLGRLADDFLHIYNSAFKKFEHFKPLGKEQTVKLFQDAKPVVDPKTSCFAYYDGEPAGFTVLLVEINQYFKSANGRVRPWHIPRLLYELKFGKNRDLKGVAFGVTEEHQKKGLVPVMIDFLYFSYQPDLSKRYKDFYLSTIRAHNKIMVDTVLNLGCQIDRTHITYRKMLDDSIPFEPFPFLEV